MADEQQQTAQGAGANGGQNAGGQGAPAQTGGGPARTFTQAELDAIIADRLARERERYKDYDSLRQQAAELQKLKQAQMTETERLQTAAAENERRAIAAEARVAATEIRADFAEKALAAGVTDIRLAYLAAQADGLLGDYDPEKGVGRHNIEELRKRYPHLFRAAPGGSADGGAGGGTRAAASMNEFIRRAARRSG